MPISATPRPEAAQVLVRRIIRAPRARVWSAWLNVSGWPRWDPTVAAASLDGPFREGTYGRLGLVGGPTVRIRIAAVREGEGFDVVTGIPSLWLAWVRLHFTHRIEVLGEEHLAVEHALHLSGAGSAWLYARRAETFREDLGKAIDGLAVHCESGTQKVPA